MEKEAGRTRTEKERSGKEKRRKADIEMRRK